MSALLHVLAESAQIDVDALPKWDAEVATATEARRTGDRRTEQRVDTTEIIQEVGINPLETDPKSFQCQPEVRVFHVIILNINCGVVMQ